MNNNNIEISLKEYNELISIKERLDCILKIISTDGYVSIGTILLIAGTERAEECLEKIKRKEI